MLDVKSQYDNTTLASKFIELADKFENYYNENKTVLDFCQTRVREHPCGTVACHGGFGLCILPDEDDGDYCLDFQDGANRIAEFLGFEHQRQLENWACQNSDFWGNIYGGEMFSECGFKSFNFGYAGRDKITLLDIAKHYRLVANNLLTIKED